MKHETLSKLLAAVPWILLAESCSCPVQTPMMKLTPDGIATLGQARPGTQLPADRCADLCEGHAHAKGNGASAMYWSCTLIRDGDDMLVDCSGTMPCIGGRRPEGATLAATNQDRYFGSLAELEGLSVVAFVQLAEALAAHGAPPELVSRALVAAREEVRHARVALGLALARGERPETIIVARADIPILESLAMENAREGCVREAFGAEIAAHQAAHARDGDVRFAMGEIARDELAHARLSRAVDAWASGRLRAPSRSRIKEAKELARVELVTEASTEVSASRRGAMGWPSAERAVALAARV